MPEYEEVKQSAAKGVDFNSGFRHPETMPAKYDVDGIMLPHKIETSLDGEPNEEWTIEKYKVNPTIKADTWEKK